MDRQDRGHRRGSAGTLATLVTVMTDLGNVWGDDDLGRCFFYGKPGHPGFRDARDALVREAEVLIEMLGGVSERGAGMARTYQQADGSPFRLPPAHPRPVMAARYWCRRAG